MPLTAASILSNLKSESIGIGSRPAEMDVDLDPPYRSLYCEGQGAVTFIGLDDEEDTWNVPDFHTIPIAMKKIISATTTATGLHGVV